MAAQALKETLIFVAFLASPIVALQIFEALRFVWKELKK